MSTGAQAPAAEKPAATVAVPDLKTLAAGAENALNQIAGKVDQVLIQPIRALVDAAKQ
jgi:hypothetical protein